MKSVFLKLLTATGLAFISLTLSVAAFAADYPELKLKFGHPYNETHPLGRAAQRFADSVKAERGGKFVVQVFPNSTIVSSRDLIEAMQINAVDLALVPTTNVASFYPSLDVFYLPFIFRDRQHAYAVADGKVGQDMFEEMRSQINIRTLAMLESGFRTITTRKKQIQTPEDMKGVKFRVINNPMNVSTFAALDAIPTPMALSEVFTALQQGIVDGQDNPVGNVKAFGFDKVQKFITLSNHQWAGIMFLTNDRKWGKYPQEVQNLLQNCADEVEAWERIELNNVEQQYLAGMEADGMTVTRLTPEQTAAFQSKMENVWNKYRNRIGAELIQAVVDTQ